MCDWKKQMHNSTHALISAINRLHCTSSSANDSAVVCELVNSMAAMIRTQESVNIQLLEQLREHQRRLLTTEKRLTEIQQEVKRAQENVEKNKGEFDHSSHAACRLASSKRRKMVDESPLYPEHDIAPNRSLMTKEQTHGLANSSQPLSIESGSTKVRQKTPQLRRLGQGGLSSTSEQKQPVLLSNEVKPPFTGAEVKRERTQRQKKKRDCERLEPVPCEKCCAIKRNELNKKYGYVPQDMYHRFAETRGGCYFYVHDDEKLPDNYPRSQISFDESATQSPEQLT